MAGYQGGLILLKTVLVWVGNILKKKKSSNRASVPLIFGRMFLNMRKPMKRLLSYLMRHQQRFLVRMMLLLQICILNG